MTDDVVSVLVSSQLTCTISTHPTDIGLQLSQYCLCGLGWVHILMGGATGGCGGHCSPLLGPGGTGGTGGTMKIICLMSNLCFYIRQSFEVLWLYSVQVTEVNLKIRQILRICLIHMNMWQTRYFTCLALLCLLFKVTVYITETGMQYAGSKFLNFSINNVPSLNPHRSLRPQFPVSIHHPLPVFSRRPCPSPWFQVLWVNYTFRFRIKVKASATVTKQSWRRCRVQNSKRTGR